MLDGAVYKYKGPGIPEEFKWMHVVPWDYDHAHLNNSTIFCFTDTDKGKEAMDDWLKSNCLWRAYEHYKSLHHKVVNYIATPSYENSKQYIKRFMKKNLHDTTREFLDKLEEIELKASDPDIIKKLNGPELLLVGPILHSSLAYAEPNFNDPIDPLTTDQVMELCGPNFIPNLQDIPRTDNMNPAKNTWSHVISSAHVPSGVLRLFGQNNYMGPQLFLWGPNGEYPYLSDFAFDETAVSLQQG